MALGEVFHNGNTFMNMLSPPNLWAVPNPFFCCTCYICCVEALLFLAMPESSGASWGSTEKYQDEIFFIC